ncbi:MAG TPA: DUF2071 domain-containing protein [Gaiellaceae bacterium]|nr:DUF2071 domain-containing protein [Gaiellaceae bacterium]
MTLDFLDTASRQAHVVDDVEHRPWPVPDVPWAQAQSWVDIAFLHWRIDPAALQRLLPGSVELQTFDGAAWLGITPFLLSGLRLRGLPPLPGVSTFPALNVRTYVTLDERPGLWFFTLDVGSTLVGEAEKRLYRLPYHRAQMRYVRDGGFVNHESARAGAAFSASYRGVGDVFDAETGSLDEFLTDRYCVYTEDGGRVYRAELHHRRWQLQHGEAHIDLNTMAPLPLPAEAPHVLFSQRQDVVIWPLIELDG